MRQLFEYLKGICLSQNWILSPGIHIAALDLQNAMFTAFKVVIKSELDGMIDMNVTLLPGAVGEEARVKVVSKNNDGVEKEYELPYNQLNQLLRTGKALDVTDVTSYDNSK